MPFTTPERMPPPFAAAVIALKPGEYTRKPVQTQYGWHVIQLIETRDLSPPSYDQVKGRLEQMVQQKKFRKYMDELMASAKVEKLDQPRPRLRRVQRRLRAQPPRQPRLRGGALRGPGPGDDA